MARGLRELAVERLADLPLDGLEAVTLSVGVASFGNGEEVPTPDELLTRPTTRCTTPSGRAATACPPAHPA